jgi:hypothetical protein
MHENNKINTPSAKKKRTISKLPAKSYLVIKKQKRLLPRKKQKLIIFA